MSSGGAPMNNFSRRIETASAKYDNPDLAFLLIFLNQLSPTHEHETHIASEAAYPPFREFWNQNYQNK
ncbi:MAG: hypothetical protein AB7V56_04995 [Candidatus Nitrosocosmicus sp.]